MENASSGVPSPITPDIEALVTRVACRKDAWIRVGRAERAVYLRRAIAGVVESSEDWVASACAAQAVEPGSPVAGELRISGPVVTVRGLRLLAESLERDEGPVPPSIRQAPGGRLAARVFPASLHDALLYPGMVGEIWIEPGKPFSQGRLYREKAAGRFGEGRMCLILGAGNIASIPPLDVAHKLFAEDQVVVLKLNPVNAYLDPVFRRAFRALIDDGFLAIASGGPDLGDHLVRHDRVDTLHLTGSTATYDAIVWGGTPEEQARRKAAREPRFSKPFSAELGSVTPILVVPGPWTRRDIERQAASVAGMVFHNASFNCNAAKVLVLARGWALRGAFLDAVRRALARLPARHAYYPGAEDRYQRFLESHPGAEALGPRGEGMVPWTLIPEVPPRTGEFALTHEAFCGVLATTEVDATEAGGYLARAPDFVNESVWGTLSCVVLVDPTTQRLHRTALDDAIARLRYGGIGINVWGGLIFGLGILTWGAFPGHTPEDIVSGHGAVHNGALIDDPERSVLRGPFRPLIKTAWDPGFRTLEPLSRRLLAFEAAPSLAKLPAIVLDALRA